MINTAVIPWVAFREAFDSQPQRLEEGIFLKGLKSILGATRPETAARAKKWADTKLIKSDKR